MNRVLEDYERQFAGAGSAIRGLVNGLTERDLQWRSRPGRWSIVECLDHLNAGWLSLPKLDRKIAEARSKGWLGDGPFREPWLGRLYVRAIEPPVRLRLPAPKRYRPRAMAASSDVVPKLLALQDELIGRVRTADGLDVGAILLTSPITRRFRMSLGQWFAFLAAHERRHIWQAENVRRRLGI